MWSALCSSDRLEFRRGCGFRIRTLVECGARHTETFRSVYASDGTEEQVRQCRGVARV